MGDIANNDANIVPGSASILVADTDETQNYVFESNRLPEIRGASKQLDALNRSTANDILAASGKLVYAGGGSLVALVDVSMAADLAKAVESAYRSETTVATTSATARQLPANYESNLFGEYVRWAGHCLRRHKESKEAPPFVEISAYQSVCRSCQRRPANAALQQKSTDQPICSVCHRKQRVGQRRGPGAETWHDRFESWLAKPQNSQLRDRYLGKLSGPQVDIPQTVDEIAATRLGREGYIGMVYLDGDRIGDLITQMQSLDNFRTLSDGLSSAMQDSVFSTLAHVLRPMTVKGSAFREDIGQSDQVDQDIIIHPFEVITIGGDDAILLLPSYAAIPIATRIGQRFGEQTTQLAQKMLPAAKPHVNMSAGVVLGDDRTPVRLLFELSKQLLREAKKVGGALDYHILKSADMIDGQISTLRESYPNLLKKAGDGGMDLRLTARPYTHAQVDSLWKGAVSLAEKGFPRSQLGQLSQSLLDGRAAATLFYQYQHHRSGHEGYTVLDETLIAVQNSNTDDPLPWRSVAGESFSHDTALRDLAELFEFVP